MRIVKTDKLYCFSPPIMILTFVLEVSFALYVLFRYKLTPIARLAVATLIGLAVFQLAEFNVCEGAFGMDSLTWARIGYVAITLLPPLGIHLASTIAGRKDRLLVGFAYGIAAVFSYIFLFAGQGMTSQVCLGNYVIFNIASWAVIPYTIYYYGWLAFTTSYAVWQALKKKGSTRAALLTLAAGYVAFVLPTTAVNVIDPATIAGIPSIMCGFAVILALVLTFKVVPLAHKTGK